MNHSVLTTPAGRKVVVTGASGALGLALCERLVREAAEVVAVAREPNAPRLRRLAAAGARVVRADVTVLGAMAKVPPADVLVHLVETRDEGAGREEVWRINVGSTCNVLDWARSSGIGRVVVRGSTKAVGGLELGEVPVDESRPCRPEGLIGRSKLAVERVAQQWAERHRVPLAVARLAPVLGGEACSEPLERAVVYAMTGMLREQPRDVLLQPIVLADAAEALRLLLLDPRNAIRTYLVAGAVRLTERTLFRQVAALASRPSLVDRLPERPVAAGPLHEGWSCERFARELGGRARASIEVEIVRALAAFMQSRSRQSTPPPGAFVGLVRRMRKLVAPPGSGQALRRSPERAA